jgi:uncharacterized YigZ family protein
MSYLTVARPAEVEEIIKGSRFLGFAFTVDSASEAGPRLEEVQGRHRGASHHPWAYAIGAEYRFSDDGEPGGTAGRPMLEVLQRRGLDHVLGVVARYFGGTKLGAGGLVRAYSGTLAKALDAAGVREVKPRMRLQVHLPFGDMDAAHRLLDGWAELEKGPPDYDGEGMKLELELPLEDIDALKGELVRLSRGAVRFL